jgi:glycosyl transferase, family 25
MKIGVYVINLNRSIARWEGLSRKADALELEVVRISGVDGSQIQPHDAADINKRQFLLRNGRNYLPGEHGCYRSHVKALTEFLESSNDAAIIMEDDVELQADLVRRAEAALGAIPKAELIKLLNHRSKGFRERAKTKFGDMIGRCVHGPQGSAACYLVTRSGAKKLLQTMSVMVYPFDIALERGWATRVNTFTVKNNLIELGPNSHQTAIATKLDYRRQKFKGMRRSVTHLLRAADYARRIRYSLW